MKRFSIIAATVSGNRGAEAMLESTIGRLRDRFPDASFSVYSYYPERDRELVSDPAVAVFSCTPSYLVTVLFPWSLLLGLARIVRVPVKGVGPRAVRALSSSDALIDLAGVSFIDGREKYLPFNILTIVPAMLLGVPVFKLAQAVGPFKHRVNRVASRILRRCRLVVARGDLTVDNLRAIGFPASLTIAAPDVAFLFEPRDSLSDEGSAEVTAAVAAIRSLESAGSSVVGVCPSAVLASRAAASGEDYVGFLVRLVRHLIARGHAVVLFPNATRAASSGLRNNDLPVIATIVEQLEPAELDSVVPVRGDTSAAGLREVVSACSCVIVSRFHAMVGALAVGVPVFVLGWSHKYLEVMRQFGQERYVFDYAQRESAEFLERLDELLAQRDAVGGEIAAALDDVRTDALKQFVEVENRLE